ncbi:tetratricopeptide repeat protein [Flavobacterium sp. XGLA_31]|uniref:tetratricopeptide repeat protein n=1 Tax=Flavobacterium sp. XGLA_31 TaxID=3447666 RepID=UPI003F330779
MKIKHIVAATVLFASASALAQKDELKTLKKIYAKDEIKAADLAEYKGLVAKVEPLATEEGDKVYAGFYKAMIPVLEYLALDKTMAPAQIQATMAKFVNPKSISDLATGLNATLDYEKKTGKKVYTDDINETITSFKPEMVDYASLLGKSNKNQEAGDVLYSIYQLDKKDQDMLFYAASYAVNGEQYDKALDYYNELKRLKYTGAGTLYLATNNATKTEENFGANKSLRDVAVSTGSHSKPREEKVPSKAGEIYKNIALILIQKGKVDEAKTAITEARKENPNDTSLILTEAELYLKVNDVATYTKLINEALTQNPNNADLIYNLGVVSANADKLDEAEKYYKQALAIDPNYFNANLNLAELKLRSDGKLVAEMNKLGTSEKDNKRYEALKAERKNNFRSVLPYLEKAVELKPEDDAAKKTLLSVYYELEMTDKYKALKAKM